MTIDRSEASRAMTRHTHHAYRGCIIWRSTTPGYHMRWTALTPNGMAAADTLAGIKQAITALPA